MSIILEISCRIRNRCCSCSITYQELYLKKVSICCTASSDSQSQGRILGRSERIRPFLPCERSVLLFWWIDDRCPYCCWYRFSTSQSKGSRRWSWTCVGPDTNSIHSRDRRTTKFDINNTWQTSSNHITICHTSPWEHIIYIHTGRGRGCKIIRDNNTITWWGHLSHKREITIETDRFLVFSSLEVNLNSHYRLRRLSNTRWTNDTSIRCSLITTSSQSTRLNITLSHVITINLNTINISHNTTTVVESSIDSSHISKTSKLITEVLSSWRSRSGATSGNITPTTGIVTVSLPVTCKTVWELPRSSLVNRRI